MKSRGGLLLILVTLLAGGAAVSFGHIDQDVDLSSALEIWGDVLRDADHFGLQITRVSDADEIEFGKKLGPHFVAPKGAAAEWEPYVKAVGGALVPYVDRKGIPYEFHVIESPAINAFALPGGQIFVMTGLLNFLETEAELAAILGHEISHVDRRHCIERFQYELALRKVAPGEIGMMVRIARSLVAVGYTKYQELDADAYAVRLSVEAGYDPVAAPAVFERLGRRSGSPTPRRARTPIHEVTGALGQAVVSYFQSHPSSRERMRRLNRLVARNRARLSGRTFYVGRQNYRQRIPRRRMEVAGDSVVASAEP